MSDTNELRARLLVHAAVHDACTSSHSDEQAQWARDLREAAELIATHAAPAAGPQQDQTPWGWAIVDKNGDELLTRPRLREFFGAVNHEREPFSATELANANREWPGIAPFSIVTLYTHPAPAVERGVTDGCEIGPRPLQYGLKDYHIAPGGEGPLAFTWSDKPHRLVYDLIAAVKHYAALAAAGARSTE